jgi:hypothetical protein
LGLTEYEIENLQNVIGITMRTEATGNFQIHGLENFLFPEQQDAFELEYYSLQSELEIDNPGTDKTRVLLEVLHMIKTALHRFAEHKQYPVYMSFLNKPDKEKAFPTVLIEYVRRAVGRSLPDNDPPPALVPRERVDISQPTDTAARLNGRNALVLYPPLDPVTDDIHTTLYWSRNGLELRDMLVWPTGGGEEPVMLSNYPLS